MRESRWAYSDEWAITIFIPDRLSNCNRRFLVRVLQNHDLGELNAESVATVRNQSCYWD